MIAGYAKSVMSVKRKGTRVSKEYITLAHYPQGREDLELHQSSYGLCTECSTFTNYVPYPCPVIEEAGDE
jgi:hypothetical protein